MTDEQINAAIAQACGWANVWRAPNVSETAYFVGTNSSGEFLPVPNYCTDLDAMHEAEKALNTDSLFDEYYLTLYETTRRPVCATARQRAEAFLRTLGKWEEVAK